MWKARDTVFEKHAKRLLTRLLFDFRAIPGKVSVAFKDCSIRFLEHVQIRVDLDFMHRGDLNLQLTAPSGTVSPMTGMRPMDSRLSFRNLTDWHITTVFHWGESPEGTWELSVEDFDKQTVTSGNFLCWTLLIFRICRTGLVEARRTRM